MSWHSDTHGDLVVKLKVSQAFSSSLITTAGQLQPNPQTHTRRVDMLDRTPGVV